MKTRILGFVAVGLLAGPMTANATWLGLEDGNYTFVTSGCTPDMPDCGVSGSLAIQGPAATFLSLLIGGVLFEGDPVDDALSGGEERSSLIVSSPFSFVSLTYSPNGFFGPTRFFTYCVNVSSSSCRLTGSFWTAARVPEPGTLALLGLGLAGLGLSRRRKAA